MNPSSEQPPDSENRSERQQEFLNSWKGSTVGRRPGAGVPSRGLRGIAVIAGTIAAVTAVVIGGGWPRWTRSPLPVTRRPRTPR